MAQNSNQRSGSSAFSGRPRRRRALSPTKEAKQSGARQASGNTASRPSASSRRPPAKAPKSASATPPLKLTSRRVFEDASATDTTTVGERRRDIRREQRVKKGRTLSIRLLIIAGLVMLLAVAGVIAYNSEFLAISEVRVNGAEHLSADHLKEVAAVPVGSTLLRVDTEGIKARLEADPWIKQASVERELPATLILNISERRVFAQAEIIPDVTNATITHWLISEDGVWLGTLDGPEETQVLGNLDLKGLVMIKDVSRAVRPQLGAEVKDEGVANALAILAGFSDEMRGLVATISAPDRTRTTLGLLNNVGVAFGAAEDIPAKESAIITLLNAHPDTLTYINVRVPDRATYRAVE